MAMTVERMFPKARRRYKASQANPKTFCSICPIYEKKKEFV